MTKVANRPRKMLSEQEKTREQLDWSLERLVFHNKVPDWTVTADYCALHWLDLLLFEILSVCEATEL